MFVTNFALLICAFSIHTGVAQSEINTGDVRSEVPKGVPNSPDSIVATGKLNVPNSKDEYNTMLGQAKTNLVVVYFTATWCGPCRTLEKEIKKFAGTYTDVTFIKADVDKIMTSEEQMNDDMPLPVVKFIILGDMVDSIIGVKKEDTEKKIKELEKTSPPESAR